MGDERCPREAGLDVVTALSDQLGKSFAGELFVFASSSPKTIASAYGVSASLWIDAFRPDVMLVECGSGALCKLAEMLSVPMTAKKTCGIS